MNIVDKIISNIKATIVTDKRVAIFNVEFDQQNKILKGETNLKQVKDILIQEIKFYKIDFKDEVEVLPSKNLGDKIYGVVNLSVSNIRTKPDHPEELSTQALLGTPVKIFKKQDGFYLIQTPDKYISWVDDDGITPMNKKELDEWIKSPKIIFTKEFGFSFSNPDINSLRVSDLVAGNLLLLLNEENNFYKVKYPDGRIAFVEKINCEVYSNWLNNLKPTKESIVNTAKLFMGVPYLWGGTSVKGMDCSGFTKTVYFLNGIILQRDASQQVNDGILVDTRDGFDKLQPGDLLFFGKHATDSTKEKITHVGIYIGNYEFIHEAGRVKINSFDKDAEHFSEYRLKHFIRAKRILNSINRNGITTLKTNKFYLGEME
ncbi:MAG: C40 family peptidase [Melioribacteraceae bacterium]|nr:C40 family peptidase [Melioribacteraceae bacterium]